jgi:hypothetical protein
MRGGIPRRRVIAPTASSVMPETPPTQVVELGYGGNERLMMKDPHVRGGDQSSPRTR